MRVCHAHHATQIPDSIATFEIVTFEEVIRASTKFYQFFDQTWHIDEELKANYAFAILGVFLITFLLIPNWTGTLLLCAVVCMVDVDLTGIINNEYINTHAYGAESFFIQR